MSRSIYAGVSILATAADRHRGSVVIHLCTNWSQTTFGHEIDAAMATLSGVDRVIWVTCTPWNPASSQPTRPSAWRRCNTDPGWWWRTGRRSAPRPGYTYTDGLHLKTAGAEAMARLIARLAGPAPVSPPTTALPRPPDSTSSTAATTGRSTNPDLLRHQ